MTHSGKMSLRAELKSRWRWAGRWFVTRQTRCLKEDTLMDNDEAGVETRHLSGLVMSGGLRSVNRVTDNERDYGAALPFDCLQSPT